MNDDRLVAARGTATDFAAFHKAISYPVAATNVPGIFATTQLPDATDLNASGSATLLRHGIPFRRPDDGDRPALRDAWAAVFARAKPLTLIVPEMTAVRRPARRSRLMLTSSGASTSFSGNAWAGGVFAATATGPWTSATGSWTIPTVSKPSEVAGTEGGWHCTSWVGIDGYTAPGYVGTTDVLQIGIEQKVDTAGDTTCVAWFEWFVPPVISGAVTSISAGKIVLQQSPFRPSLAATGGRLYLAWRGDGNDQMNVAMSTDGGRSFGRPLVTSDTSQSAPAIAAANGRLYLAWRGDGNDNLSVMQVVLDPASGAPTGLTGKTILPDTSKSAPTLAGLNGAIYLGWRGEGNDYLCILPSVDGGATWGRQLVVSSDTTPVSPCLAACNGQLVLAWKGDGNDNLNVAAVALGSDRTPTAIGQKVTLGEQSPDSPSLTEANGFIYLSWKGDGNDNLNVAVSGDNGASFGSPYVSGEHSPFATALATVNGQPMIAWRGDGNDSLNVAPVTSNFNESAYRNQLNISNFPVKPGDYVTASVTYNGTTSGVVSLANNTTGQAFSLTIAPPAGANFSGQCVEWIMEAPDSGEPTSALPSFTTVNFVQAFGCAAQDKATANPSAGDTTNVSDSAGKVLTSVTTASDAVTISFIG